MSDSWDELCERLVDDVCGTRNGTLTPLMSSDDCGQLVQYMKEMKFLAGGRYLYYAGREFKAYNNCLSSDTAFITNQGMRTFSSFKDGDTVHILSPVSGGFTPATVRSFGEQQLYNITFENVRGRSNKQWTVKATANHRWPLMNRQVTENLTLGDIVKASAYHPTVDAADEYLSGLRHGMVFADGNVHVQQSGFAHQLRLCGSKAKYLSVFDDEDMTVTYPPFASGDPVIYVKSPFSLKELPPVSSSLEYTRGFLTGWDKLDGHHGKVHQLHSVNKEAIQFYVDWCWLCGEVVTGEIIGDDSPTNFGERSSTLWRINIKHGEDFAGFKVVAIEPANVETVWCVVEPKHNQFTLEYGIATGNCYLLRAEEDTREEWANVVWRAMSCLTTGGGIGVDYSILRPKGRVLRRTGGKASGPIPLMQAVNEVGRNVMQGGSRRSAIYASLNWQHEDITDFLKVKDWASMPIGNSGLTIADAKMADFNYPAPLDMTNISVNYDDAWLNDPNRAKNPVFLENCRQAMKTGEPGFSFNFGAKQNETLRNACTEVTSEDDSDVCNLGSINMGNIDSIEEFQSVVHLASKFLVCGTLRADLPYEKVRKVREKNRRLGLGLMGIHEWLLKRGYKYEVTPELHKWLGVYRDESKASSDAHCERLYVSKPVAYRAIAPTGSIGILAGTTTGIEPLFAVAYKRRYLTDGTKWKYEYVVDSTADLLIREYGLDPDSIDTAYKLSHDFERRIKFQADIQDYVDMSISSTINLPSWGSKGNSESDVMGFAAILAAYAPRLRGFTCYPDGSRGGQPLTEVPYKEAVAHKGVVFEEHDVCEITSKGGTCGS